MAFQMCNGQIEILDSATLQNFCFPISENLKNIYPVAQPQHL